MVIKYSKSLFFLLIFSSCAYASEVIVTPGRYYGGDVVNVPVKYSAKDAKKVKQTKMDILQEPEGFERSRKLFRESRATHFKEMRGRFNPDVRCANEGKCR